jgi:hypothetical protein
VGSLGSSPRAALYQFVEKPIYVVIPRSGWQRGISYLAVWGYPLDSGSPNMYYARPWRITLGRWRNSRPASARAGVPGLSVPTPLAGRIPLPALRCQQSLVPGFGFVAVCRLRPASFGHGGNDLPGYPHSAQGLVPGHVVVTAQKNGVSALGLQRGWAWGAIRGRGLGCINCAGRW